MLPVSHATTISHVVSITGTPIMTKRQHDGEERLQPPSLQASFT